MPKSDIQRDPRSVYVKKLHNAYCRGKLNVFIGAGISQESGFAGWEPFNRELIRQYLASEIGTTTPAAMLASSNIEATADDLYNALGRDAVADFVHRLAPKRFGSLLASVLYGRRPVDDLPVKSVHNQIASLSKKARLFTLNFDPLLELALARRFSSKRWVGFRSPDRDGRILRGKHKVEHLHGWIDPDGTMSPDVVLTESHYFELTENSRAVANRFLERMLASANTTLILGMSLADPNFRRVLYFLNKRDRSSRERIYVVMRQQKPTVDHYAQVHWVSRGLRLLFVKQHDDIPGLLRDVEWGEASASQLPRWTKEAILWRRRRLPDSAIFTDAWQKAAYTSLDALAQQVRHLFGVGQEEKIQFGLFVPFLEPGGHSRLRMIAASRKFVNRDGALFRASRRALSITKGEEQGIAGLCFATGTNRAVAYGEGEVDINFTSEMSEGWVSHEGYRDWRSITAITIIDTEHWIPVAVIALTSNMSEPFWKQFGAKQNLLEPELHAVLRRTAHFCLVDLLPRVLHRIK